MADTPDEDDELSIGRHEAAGWLIVSIGAIA
jgi:hypothetical protein